MHRSFLVPLLFAGAAAVATAPAVAQIVPDVVTSVAVSGTSHQLNWSLRTGQGYRPISLSVAGTRSTAEYTTVWIRRSGAGFAGVHGVDRATYDAWAATQRANGLRPYLLSASGATPNEVFAGVWMADGGDAQEFTGDGVSTRSAWARDNGYVPCFVSRWTENGFARYASVWEHPTDRAYGAMFLTPDSEYQGHFDAHASAFQRLATAVRVSSTQILHAWRDDSVGGWLSLPDLTAAQLQTEITNRRPSGAYPISIQQYGTGTAARFMVVFANRDRPLARTLTRTGLAVIPMAGFDQYMEAHVRAHGIRSSAIAVTKHGRLVYARGYSLAESGVAPTEPTDMFRIASASKPLTALMVHLLYQRGGTLTPSTTFASYLGLNPIDARFQQATVQQAIQHRAGFTSDMNSFSIASWLNPSSPVLPVSQAANAQYVAGHSMATTPGTAYDYSNIGYYMLCEAIKTASGKSYQSFLRDDIGAPLGIDRLWVSGSTVASRRTGEVEFRNRDLIVDASQLHTDRRPLPIQYGGSGDDNLSRRAGAGGVLTSPVDYVRILAGCFDMAGDGGIFTPSQAATMLAAPTLTGATAVGFDTHTVRANGVISRSKNGMLWGSSAQVIYRSDGVAIAVFDNLSNNTASVEQLNAAADAVTAWPTHDLFPSYGLPAFARTRPRVESLDRTTLPNVTQDVVTVRGEVLANVDRVTIGATAVTSLFSWTWSDGWLRRVSDTELEVHLPQGLVPGTYDFVVHNGLRASTPIPFTITRATARTLGGPTSTPLGYELVGSRGSSSLASLVYLAASPSTVPSVLPGTVSLGLGNNFAQLIVLGPYAFERFTGAVRVAIPDLGAQRWNFQLGVLDPSAPQAFPLATSNVHTVQGL